MVTLFCVSPDETLYATLLFNLVFVCPHHLANIVLENRYAIERYCAI